MSSAWIALAAPLAFLCGVGAAEAIQVRALFPGDRFTVPDPAQLTGRRLALPLPRCASDPSGCDEVRLLNQLDGFSVNPRVALRFTRPVDLDSVERGGAFILPLWTEPLPSPVGLVQLVWDGEQNTLHARPERVLLQGRRYALVVTSRVLGADGRPARTAADGTVAPGARIDGATASLVFKRLAELGIKRHKVAAFSLFTTQSVSTDLERIRALVDERPAPELRFTLEPGGSRSVYARADLQTLELRRQLAAPGEPLADPLRLPLGLLPPATVKTLAVGNFRSVSFLSADRHIPAVASRAGMPRPTGEEEIHVTVALPQGPTPAEGWPVAIFGHGYAGDRHGSLLAVAGRMARLGFATVAITVVGHGGGPEGRLTVTRASQPPVTLPAGGRGLDLDADGKIGRAEGLGTLNRGALALLGIRDGLRQTVADLLQLIRALRRGVDVDGDGRRDLDPGRIYSFGQSLGGIYGTLLMAIDPHVKVGVLNVPGGPIVEIARLAAGFRPVVVEHLSRRTPPLLNGDKEFHESIPLYGEPPVRSARPGALEIQAFFDRAEWVSQSASPVAFAPYLRQAPLPGVGPKSVLFQFALGDLTVPNPTTANILRSGELQLFTVAYRHDRVVKTLPERFRDPHAFLTWTVYPEVADIGRAAQGQVGGFFLSGGREIHRVDDRFDVQFPLP
jgi:dienelactone hydrolase